MMKQILYLLVCMISILSNYAFANQDSNSKQLMERIESLEARIAILESRFSFASFMPDFAERFHVMHQAAEADDWAVAGHELQEMKSMIESSTTIDAEKGQLFQAMMGPVIEQMEGAIGHGDGEKMHALLNQATQTCNSCHAATGSSFIKVSLDASATLSMRHPHALTRQKPNMKHMH
jgi:hypothetical protein